MIRRILILAMILAVVSGTALAANEPYVISFQGKLEGVTLPVNIIFTLYDAETGGSSVWTETHNGVDVDVDTGIFNELLGNQQDLSNALLSATGGLWMQINVNGSDLTPRQPLTAAPYAFVARSVNAVGSTSSPYSYLVGAKNNGNGIGVYGYSKGGSGVFGSSEASGLGLAGVFGFNTSASGIGVSGFSIGGMGVLGISGAPSMAGVVGLNNVSGGIGVFGSATNGSGVYGSSTNNNGVYGVSTNNDGIYGKSSVSGKAGVYGENTQGYGVVGNGTDAGGFFTSYNDAIEIQSGRIKIQNKGTGVGSQQYRNYVAAGTVEVADGVNEVTVYNGYVANDSIILLTNQGGPNCSLKVSSIVQGDHFTIYVWRRHFHAGATIVTESGAVKVAYLIIN